MPRGLPAHGMRGVFVCCDCERSRTRDKVKPLMDPSSPATRTLRRAAGIAGEAGLAVLLDVPLEQLRAWLRGEERPPPAVYFKALDIVAGCPRAIRPATGRPIRS